MHLFGCSFLQRCSGLFCFLLLLLFCSLLAGSCCSCEWGQQLHLFYTAQVFFWPPIGMSLNFNPLSVSGPRNKQCGAKHAFLQIPHEPASPALGRCQTFYFTYIQQKDQSTTKLSLVSANANRCKMSRGTSYATRAVMRLWQDQVITVVVIAGVIQLIETNLSHPAT